LGKPVLDSDDTKKIRVKDLAPIDIDIDIFLSVAH